MPLEDNEVVELLPILIATARLYARSHEQAELMVEQTLQAAIVDAERKPGQKTTSEWLLEMLPKLADKDRRERSVRTSS